MPSPTTPPLSERDEEAVTPRRAAQRLYDEMAHAYHEQAELDREIAKAILPAALKSLRHEEE